MKEDEVMARAVSRAKSAGASKEGRGVKKSGVIVFLVGLAAIVCGLVFMLTQLFSGAAMADAEFLVSSGTWVREDEPSVVWKFTEVGKGSLTTNGGENEYEFLWAISGDKLQIETEWLYDKYDEFLYELDQGAGILTLGEGAGKIVFKTVET